MGSARWVEYVIEELYVERDHRTGAARELCMGRRQTLRLCSVSRIQAGSTADVQEMTVGDHLVWSDTVDPRIRQECQIQCDRSGNIGMGHNRGKG